MGIRQLEEFLGQADQKGFWIFTYANLAGAFLGAFLGNSLFDAAAPVVKLPSILTGVLLGVMTTWKVKGRPIYVWVLSYVLFVLRRYLKLGLGDATIDAALYYRARTIERVPFMLVTTRGGKRVPVLVHRGSGASAYAWEGLDNLLAPATVEGKVRVANPGAPRLQREGGAIDLPDTFHPHAATPSNADAPAHSDFDGRRSSQGGTAAEALDGDYLEWGL